jgi:hypothetical protein
MPCPDLNGDHSLSRQMDMMPLHFQQAFLTNGVEKSSRGAVVEKFGRDLWRILQVNVDRMTLAGTDARPLIVEGEAFLVTGGHDVLELLQSESDTVAIYCLQQLGHRGPSGAVELKPNPFRLVPQHQAEKLAGSDDFFVSHGSKSYADGFSGSEPVHWNRLTAGAQRNNPAHDCRVRVAIPANADSLRQSLNIIVEVVSGCP